MDERGKSTVHRFGALQGRRLGAIEAVLRLQPLVALREVLLQLEALQEFGVAQAGTLSQVESLAQTVELFVVRDEHKGVEQAAEVRNSEEAAARGIELVESSAKVLRCGEKRNELTFTMST